MRAPRKLSPPAGQAVPASRSVTMMGDIEPDKCPVRNIAQRVELVHCRGMEIIYVGMCEAYGYEYDEGLFVLFMGQRYALVGDVVNYETRLQYLVDPDILHTFGWIGQSACEKLKAWNKARRLQLLRNRLAAVESEITRLTTV